MGLFGLALDGNTGKNHKLYVADMNGRILRLDLAKHPAAPEVFSQVPADTGLAGDWMKAMWNDLSSTRPATSTCRTTSHGSGGSARRHRVDLVHRSAADWLLRVRRRAARRPHRSERQVALYLDHGRGGAAR